MKCQINVKLICHFVKPGKRTTDSGAERKKERRWGTDRGHQRRAEREGRESALWPNTAVNQCELKRVR